MATKVQFLHYSVHVCLILCVLSWWSSVGVVGMGPLGRRLTGTQVGAGQSQVSFTLYREASESEWEAWLGSREGEEDERVLGGKRRIPTVHYSYRVTHPAPPCTKPEQLDNKRMGSTWSKREVQTGSASQLPFSRPSTLLARRRRSCESAIIFPGRRRVPTRVTTARPSPSTHTPGSGGDVSRPEGVVGTEEGPLAEEFIQWANSVSASQPTTSDSSLSALEDTEDSDLSLPGRKCRPGQRIGPHGLCAQRVTR